MNKTKAKRNLLKDKRGVSPAIASLVLIVIAVVAAAGVGVITNTLNLQTEEQAEGKDLSVAGKIDMQGSTTVLPFALAAAGTYMEDHPAVEILVSGGGSTHGKSMAKVAKVDIGMASSPATGDIIQDGGKGAVLYETEIGKRMIVVIVNDGSAAENEYNITTNTSTTGNIKFADLKALYESGTQVTSGSVNFTNAFDRSDSSGTEEGFAYWLELETGADHQLNKHSSVEGKIGNPGVLAAVAANPNSIGFVDLGYVIDSTDAAYKATMNGTAATAANYVPYETASDDVNGGETKTLTSGLYYYTYGVPSGATKAFIDFCLSPATGEGQDILATVGLIKLADAA